MRERAREMEALASLKGVSEEMSDEEIMRDIKAKSTRSKAIPLSRTE
jgi:hypothetical protein